MQQPHEREVTVYVDITEVRMETRWLTVRSSSLPAGYCWGLPPDNSWGTRTQEIPEGAEEERNSLRTPSSVCSAWLAMSWEKDENHKSRRFTAVLGLSLLR
jgi:hypothetical protein